MPNCKICEKPIVKECVNISEKLKKEHNLDQVCTWCSIDVIKGKIKIPE